MQCWPYQIDWSATGTMLTGIGTLGVALVGFLAARSWRTQQRETKLSEAATIALAAMAEVSSMFEYLTQRAPTVLAPLKDSNTKPTSEQILLFRALCNSLQSQSSRLNKRIEEVWECGYFLRQATGDATLDHLLSFADMAASRTGLLNSYVEMIDLVTKSFPAEFSEKLTPTIQKWDLGIFSAEPGSIHATMLLGRSTAEPTLRSMISVYSERKSFVGL